MNPQAPVPGPPVERALMLAALAFDMGLINRQQMCQAIEQWFKSPHKPLVEVLVTSGWISADDGLVLEKLADRHQESDQSEAGEPPPTNRQISAPTVDNQPSDSSQAGASQLARSFLRTIRDQPIRTGGQAGSEDANSRGLSGLNTSNYRFRLLRPYALGGLGVVSVAQDYELNREVAVKEMRPDSTSDEAVQRFLLEARVTGQLDHPGIPPVYALGYFEDGRPFYVMRLIEGKTLKAAIQSFHEKFPSPDVSRERSLELRKLLGDLVSVCNTLRYAHSRNVLHRDIKPSNIMLGEYGETLVLDWGLAKSKEQSLPFSIVDSKTVHSRRKTDDPTQTGTGSVLGTPHYMSPEQARGEWESVNFRSDVYSVGATLYTLLTGKLPFQAATRDEVLELVRQGKLVRPREVDARVPLALEAICLKAMALEREDRFANTGEMASEIEHWLADEPINSYREPTVVRWHRWLKERQSLVASLIVLLTTGFIALMIGFAAVTVEHRAARRATEAAGEIEQRAAQNLAEARQLVSSFLLIDTDKYLATLPGSEKIRMDMVDQSIDLLTRWANAQPQDGRFQMELAIAYRERHRIHKSLQKDHAAWADLSQALSLVERFILFPDRSIRSKAIHLRLLMLSEAAELLPRVSDTFAALQFAEWMHLQTSQILQKSPTDPALRLHVIQVNMLLASLLLEHDQVTRAAELADIASTHIERMRSIADATAANASIVDADRVLQELSIESRYIQAITAHALGDHIFAMDCLRALRESLETNRAQNSIRPWALEIELAARYLEIEISSQTLAKPDATLLRELDGLLSASISRLQQRPTSGMLLETALQAGRLKAELLMQQGDVDSSREVALQLIGLGSPASVITARRFDSVNWQLTKLHVHLLEVYCHTCQFELALAQYDAVCSQLNSLAPRSFGHAQDALVRRLNAALAGLRGEGMN